MEYVGKGCDVGRLKYFIPSRYLGRIYLRPFILVIWATMPDLPEFDPTAILASLPYGASLVASTAAYNEILKG